MYAYSSHFFVVIILACYFKLVNYNFIYLFGCTKSLVCTMWDLIPLPRIEPRPPALEPRSLSH